MKINHTTIELNSRTIVISDIHGNLELFLRLLNKIKYNSNDILIILGDIIEKGPNILETLHYIEKLNQNKNVYVLNGNCEWAIHSIVYDKNAAPFIHHYLNKQPYSIFHEILDLNQMDASKFSGEQLQDYFKRHLAHELALFDSFYTTIKTKDYLFVHAGIENREDYENSSLSSLLEQQRFLDKEHPLKQYVVVGHLPTSNYYDHHINNDIIIDHQKRIISIDGGNMVKSIGQLNALIIDEHIQKVEVHPIYPYATVIQDYIVDKHHHHKIFWPDYELEILEKGDEFSKCKKVNKDEVLMVKNEYLYQKDHKYYGKDDYIDYQMTILKGEKVEIIDQTANYSYIYYQHEIAWIPNDYLMIE